MAKKIWLKICPYCREETFGEWGSEVDELCSVCGTDIRKERVREDEIADIVKEVPKALEEEDG